MSKSSLSDSIGYYIFKGFSRLVMALSPEAALSMARLFGHITYAFSVKRRRIAYVNIKRALGNRYTPQSRRRLVKDVYVNMLQTFIEIARLPKLDVAYKKKYIEVIGEEKLKAALKQGKGVILLTAHFGNWEMTNVCAAASGYTISAFARTQKMPKLNGLLNDYRRSAGSKVITKGMSSRQIVKALLANELVGILSDQDAGKNGVFVKMFGITTSSHAGVMKFARKTGAAVIPVFIHRKRGPYHQIKLCDPLKIDYEDDSAEAIRTDVQHFSDCLAREVTAYPNQWLWMHKRWKSNPYRKILVLSDGKAGHENQSLAVSELIRAIRHDKAGDPELTTVRTVAIERPSKLRTALFWIETFLRRGECGQIAAGLKRLLKAEDYQKLMNEVPDYVISCGRHLAHINEALARENCAKSILIMSPPLGKKSRFDLCLTPRHDQPAEIKNTVITEGAINNTYQKIENFNRRKTLAELKLSDRRYAGILIGGENPYYSLKGELAKEFAENIIAFAQKNDMHILVTTSRRTHPEAEDIFRSMLKDHALCDMFILPKEENPAGIVDKIIGLSECCIVTAESVSMISEAASSGRPTIACRLNAKSPHKHRHDYFVENMRAKGHIVLIDAKELGALGHKDYAELTRLNDDERVRKALERVV